MRYAAAAAALLAVTACDGAPWSSADPARSPVPLAPETPAAPLCGPPTRRVASGGGFGYRTGPFTFLGGQDRRGAVRVPVPAKVVFVVRSTYSQPYTVTGLRCADGAPLSFWFRDEPLGSRTLGDAQAVLPAVPRLPRRGRLGHGGYVMFASPGRWRLDFATDGRLAESVVLDVTIAR